MIYSLLFSCFSPILSAFLHSTFSFEILIEEAGKGGGNECAKCFASVCLLLACENTNDTVVSSSMYIENVYGA